MDYVDQEICCSFRSRFVFGSMCCWLVPARRRRRGLALATAVAFLASEWRTTAFSPPSAKSLLCHTTQIQQVSGDTSQQRPSSHALSMVSFVAAPPTPRQGPSQTRGRFIRGNSKEYSNIEIELQPGYDVLALDSIVVVPQCPGDVSNGMTSDEMNRCRKDVMHDSMVLSDMVTLTKQRVQEIDSEIFYEGITIATVQPASEREIEDVKESLKDSVVTSIEDGGAARETEVHKLTNITSATRFNSDGQVVNLKHNSSTMPGFIRDNQLDLHVVDFNLRRMHKLERDRTARMVRSKSAKHKDRQTSSETMYKKSPSVPDSLLEYAREVHSVSRVTPGKERELGTKTQEAMRLQRLHDDLQEKYGRSPNDDEWCAAAGKMNILALQEAIEEGMRAKNQLVASNLRMVQRVVNLYIRNGLGSEYNAGDLMQDGTMALIRAAEKYEPDRGFRFSTYAMYWIRSAVKRSQTSQSRIVYVPHRVHETHKRVSKNEVRLRKELGRKATEDEVAAACDISLTQLDRCRRAMAQATFSLDAELENKHKLNSGNTRRDTMYDVVEGRVDETEYERMQRLLMKEHLIRTLKRYLSPHEADLLLLRYGLMDDRALPRGMSGPLTIAEVSKLVGLKPDKVRRIIINSQNQLRHVMKEWEDFDYELA